MTGLDDMYLFKNVVECGGLSAAARRFSIPKSTVARRISELETRLGVKLFHRGARSFQLTNFGADCYETCSKMAAEADKVLAMAERSRLKPAGFLHVICPPLLGSLLVEGIAAEFAAAAPDVRLHLEETTGKYDPRSAQADFVIFPAFNPLQDSTLVARKICTSPYILVARPDVVQASHDSSASELLKSVNCLGLGGRDSEWVWTLRRERETMKFRFVPAFSTTLPTALLQATRRGLGVASLPRVLCGEDLENGTLVNVLPDWTPQPVSFFAIYPSGRTMTVAARKFLDLLLEHLPRMIQLGHTTGPKFAITTMD
ncbi:MAG TPA: transcriptional regulator [Rhizobium sp.]|nr:transcriptional regulator [Rhizobium sp.]